LDGKGAGLSERATVLTNAFAEAKNLVLAMGGEEDSLYGYAGIGDLMATCFSPDSRNYSFGRYLGSGLSVDETALMLNSVAEGVPTASIIGNLAKKYNVKMPIAETVNKLVSKK
ncbi:MAG: glycerol-3-phosphate acyltransferase, partial [Candidatus Ancillula sp.]|nr:glycerol-3-phosphate acyltransferase [Candidatus Ancillula sp.]